MNENAVINYFDRKATKYEAASQSWPWSKIRKSEAAAISRMMGDVSGRSLIDLGAGSGYYTRIFQSLGAVDIVAVDISAEMLAEIPPGIRTHVADITKIKLDETFKLILCAGALEFVANPAAVFRAARSLASHGSRMVVLAPDDNPIGHIYKFFHRTHGLTLNLFRPDTIRQMAELAGWRVECIERVRPFSVIGCMSVR